MQAGLDVNRMMFRTLAVLSVLAGPVAAQSVPLTRYDSLFDQLMALPNTPSRVIPVHDLAFRRDAATFLLRSGDIYQLATVDGRAVAALFVGSGRLTYTPPDSFERAHLKRTIQADSLDRTIVSAFFLFADSTWTMIEHLAGADTVTRREVAPLARSGLGSMVRQGLSYQGNRGKRYFDPHFMTALLNRETNDWFSAVVGATGGPYVFRVDPYEVEEVSVLVAKSGEAIEDSRSAVLSQSHKVQDYSAGWPAHDYKQRFSVNRYVMDLTIGTNAKSLKAKAELHLDWVGKEQSWFSLWFYQDMKLDSASWPGGVKARFARDKDSPVLWVERLATLAEGQPIPPLTLYYHGDVFAIEGAWLVMKNSAGWYPSTDVGYGAPLTSFFDLTFHTPREFQFASVGDRVSVDTTGDVINSHWVTKDPSAHASFNFGKFETFDVKDIRDLPVTVFINEEGHTQIGTPQFQERSTGKISGGVRQMNMKETVGQDVALSLNFFRDAFGEPVARRFYATEILGFHGQAFPGLIHFSFLTYQGFVMDKGEDEAFRAHEMAHQWWGLGVVPQSYRDAWISEGFAEFAGWWYTEAILRDSVAMKRILDKSRTSLMARRKLVGPLWLGTRLGDGEFPQDYSLVVYQRGAWVLQMLRTLMHDPERGGEEPFRRMIKDFYETFRALPASTRDFEEMVSRHMRAPMNWFFDSWVYGTGIPTYEWAQTVASAGAEVDWKLRVIQKDVPDNFAMIVPVHFYFADGQDGTANVMVKGPVTNFSIRLPARPKRVVFNEADAVLAEVHETRW